MLKKQYLSKKPICKVTFRVNKDEAAGAKSMTVVGSFNEWNPKANPMDSLKSGDFKTVIELEKDQSYQFRYLADGESWLNDGEADKVTNEFGGFNSVVSTDDE